VRSKVDIRITVAINEEGGEKKGLANRAANAAECIRQESDGIGQFALQERKAIVLP